MSNKYIQENANEYYRPSIDDDDINFFPNQNTVPLYHYKDGILIEKLELNKKLIINDDNYYFNDLYYLYIMFIFIIVLFLIHILTNSTNRTVYTRLI